MKPPLSCRFPRAPAAKDWGGLPDAAWHAGFQTRSCDHRYRSGDEQRRKRGDMTTVTTERDGSAQTRPGPAMPDLTLPQFVLCSANRRGSKRALVDAATGQEISYAGLAGAVQEIGAGLSARGLHPGDVLALCAPNSIEFAVAWFAAASIGAIVTTVIIVPRFGLDVFLRAVQDYGITRAEVVPPMVLGLATAAAVDDYDLSSLRLLTSAAAPLGADLARACGQRLGCRVKQAYGMTEVSGGTHIAPDAGPDRPDSLRPALP